MGNPPYLYYFNRATLRRARKGLDLPPEVELLIITSMGPHPEGCGKALSAITARMTLAHFNGATLRRARKGGDGQADNLSVIKVLQWGHAPKSAEGQRDEEVRVLYLGLQ